MPGLVLGSGNKHNFQGAKSLVCLSGVGVGGELTNTHRMYVFPVAAETNDHTCSSLKSTSVLLWFCRSETWNGSYWTKIKVPGSCAPSGSSRGGFVFLPFSAVSGCLYSWLVASCSLLRAHHSSLCFHHPWPSLSLWLLLDPSYMGLCDDIHPPT